jgi:hypothetical protein
MLDPGSLGTLIIGLEAVRLDREDPAVQRRRPRPHGGGRQALARRLRAVADRLAGPSPVINRHGEPAS